MLEISMGGLSQLLITLCILIGTIYLVSIGELEPTQLIEIWGMLGLGMGIGYINGKKTTPETK